MKEVEGVRNASILQWWLNGGVPMIGRSLKDFVQWFVQGRSHCQPSWRAVIFALDGAGESRIANRIKHYAEPVPGRYILCD